MSDDVKITRWRGLPLDENGDIVGAIPTIHSTPGRIVEAITDNMKGYVYQQFIKVDVDPAIVEKQLSEILMLKQKIEQLEKRSEVLTNIIIDVFKLSGDLCSLCKSKGEYLPHCECLTDEACLKKLIGLYGD